MITSIATVYLGSQLILNNVVPEVTYNVYGVPVSILGEA